jgi:glycosyltransferase involved in cell wall biosynthesis
LDPSVWVVIAAYNEERAIGDVLSGLKPYFPNVVIVDDGSRDATSQIARAHGANVLRHVFNRGQGAALQTGIEFALSRGAPFVATFDADGQHRVQDLQLMRKRLDETGADLALGSRFLGEAIGITTSRRLFLKAATWFELITTGVPLTDAHNGLRLIRRDAALRIRIRQDWMAHASDIIRQIGELKLKYIEVPCTIRYTDYSMAKGQSLLGSLQILKDLLMRELQR